MKIASYIKNSLIDYPAKIACVVFTRGCNWDCWYCQNKPLLIKDKNLENEFFEFLESRVGWLEGVVVCGGEPTLQSDLVEFCQKVKSMGFAVKLDTNGTNTQVVGELIDKKLVDYIAMDIKAPRAKLEKTICSRNNIDNIDKTIKLLINSQVDYEFRSTITPDFTLSDVVEMVSTIKGAKRYYLQPYKKPDYLKGDFGTVDFDLLQRMRDACNEVVETWIRN